MNKQPKIYVHNGVIGSWDALKIFVTPYTILRQATQTEVKLWLQKQK